MEPSAPHFRHRGCGCKGTELVTRKGCGLLFQSPLTSGAENSQLTSKRCPRELETLCFRLVFECDLPPLFMVAHETRCCIFVARSQLSRLQSSVEKEWTDDSLSDEFVRSFVQTESRLTSILETFFPTDDTGGV